MTLLGLSDEPAELDGYGPIDADTARRLAAHAPSMRRILVHPETGAVLSYGREHYRAPADLDGFVRVRDGQCRFPGCSRRAERADLDHTTAWEHGGRTDAANLAALCRHHHRLKHESGWRVEHEAGGVMRWTSPAGHVLRTLPERPFVPVGAGEGMARPARSDGPPPGLPAEPMSPDPRTSCERIDSETVGPGERYGVLAPF
ncbi:HNH endonuclease signature motif containing protein [Agromyces agglutinans]|uniref:HNH endonuclease signature motif containing protein n=1 Tax=Agromyces agglutinans TaxID=2662258 RepID=UPI00248472E3|nr:HNH endonuclease signature motif containing protein [Agromyces agglutinans]